MSPFLVVGLVVLSQGIQFAPGYSVGRGGAGGASVPNTYVCYGDSIMAGAGSATPICEAVIGEVEGATGTNEAVSGYTAAQISTCYFDGVPGTCTAYEESGASYVIVHGGVNSLKAGDAVTGVVEAATVAEMRAIVADALLHASRVVWLDVLPYASCTEPTCSAASLTDAHERATTYNTLKAAACADINNPRLQCVVLYDEFEDPGQEGHLLAAFGDPDGIHLEQAGTNRASCRTLTALGKACPEGW
jgi:lysophospholipase L1-like esterase